MAVVDERKLFIFKDEYRDNLESVEKRKLYNDSERFTKIDGKIYHFKETGVHFMINQLLGEVISEYFDLKTVKSIIAKPVNNCDKYVLLTELFKAKRKEYAVFSKRLFPKVEISSGIGLDNLRNLSQYCYNGKIYTLRKEKLKVLKNDIKKKLVRDFITKQTDGYNLNFLFRVRENNVQLFPLFDYEHSFMDDKCAMFFNCFDFDLSLDKVVHFVKSDTSFQELLERAMLLEIRTVVNQLENEYPIKLDDDEILEYDSIVKKKQDEIKRYKLI